MLGKDFLLGAGLTTGPILETGFLVTVLGTTVINHHPEREAITAPEINKGKVLPTDPVVQHRIEVVQQAMVVMHVCTAFAVTCRLFL